MVKCRYRKRMRWWDLNRRGKAMVLGGLATWLGSWAFQGYEIYIHPGARLSTARRSLPLLLDYPWIDAAYLALFCGAIVVMAVGLKVGVAGRRPTLPPEAPALDARPGPASYPACGSPVGAGAGEGFCSSCGQALPG